MEIKPIRSEEDYERALGDIESLFGAEPGTEEGDRLEVLITLVSAYEEVNYPVPLPDAVEAIRFHMERLGLDNRDLEQYIGSRSRVWEILNRKRRLTLPMIRKLSGGLGISVEILVQEYELDEGDNDPEPTSVDLSPFRLSLSRMQDISASDDTGQDQSEWLSVIARVTSGASVRQVSIETDQGTIVWSPSVQIATSQGSNSYSEAELYGLTSPTAIAA